MRDSHLPLQITVEPLVLLVEYKYPEIMTSGLRN